MAERLPGASGRAPQTLEGVQAARGVAALLVVLRHATATLAEPGAYGVAAFGGLFVFGRAGVEFFFVLSGFIIAYVHAGDIGRPAAFGSFWRKRLLRIYPPYWVATALLGAILLLSPSKDLSERDVVHVASSLLLLPEARQPLLGVGWSLRHEMLFYLLFSLAVLGRRAGMAALGGWAIVIVAAQAYAAATGDRLDDGALGLLVLRLFNLHFFFGMAVAWLVLHRPAWRPRLVLGAGTALFLVNGMRESFSPGVWPEQPVLTLVYGAASALILYGVAVLDRSRAWAVPRALAGLGGISYSLYLVHVIVLMVVAFVLRPLRGAMPLPVSFLLCLLAAVAAGVLFSLCVERPLLRWRGAMQPRRELGRLT